jgi:hypothetical protein
MTTEGHPFAEIEPEVTITPRPEADLKEILRTDLGSGFVPLEVGAETKWAFWDWPERVLTWVYHSRTVGTMRYRGEDLLEIANRGIGPEEEAYWAHTLYRVADESLQGVLGISRESAVRGKIEEYDATPEPLRMRLGDTATGHWVARCGDWTRGEGDVYREVVDGVFAVTVPAGEFLCLRKTLWIRNAADAGTALAELYVADTGRSVYWHRYNGPTWRNYEELGGAGVPEREYDGVVWRLYYDCMPDISL